MHAGDDGDALAPEAAGVRPLVKEGAVGEPGAEYLVAGEVDEVPVVEGVDVVDVEAGALVPLFPAFRFFETENEDEEGGESCLVDGGGEELADGGKGGLPVAFRDFSGDGHGHADEEVALAVFARPGLEEAGERGGFRGVGAPIEFVYNFLRDRFHVRFSSCSGSKGSDC